MKIYSEELTESQIERIDEIENAAYDFALILTELPAENEESEEGEYLPWDMAFIGEIADVVTDILTDEGYRVRYPFHTIDSEGKDIVCDYLDEV